MMTYAAAHPARDVFNRVTSAQPPVAHAQLLRIEHDRAVAGQTDHSSGEPLSHQTAQGKNRTPSHRDGVTVLHSFRKALAAMAAHSPSSPSTDRP
ncbi:MAG: hypothetical protein MK010_04505 [Erythrobacter sp.]|nr:hypothetical protein [Erythrobacter sp.]